MDCLILGKMTQGGFGKNFVKFLFTIFDVGANTGIYSLVAKTLNKEAKVFAFEPSSKLSKSLNKNNQINNYDIICEKIALSNKSDHQIFYDTTYENQTSASLNLKN